MKSPLASVKDKFGDKKSLVTAVEALAWFDRLWYNRADSGTEYTTDADVYADASQLRYWQYRLLEASGIAY